VLFCCAGAQLSSAFFCFNKYDDVVQAARIYDMKFITELKPEARSLACHSLPWEGENGAHRVQGEALLGLPRRERESSVNISHDIIKDPAGLFVDTFFSRLQ
jgi:hypothetical protein